MNTKGGAGNKAPQNREEQLAYIEREEDVIIHITMPGKRKKRDGKKGRDARLFWTV